MSNSGLARGGVPEPLTTAQLAALVADPPPWLTRERATHAEMRREQQRLQERGEETDKAAAATKPVVRTRTAARHTDRGRRNP